ncbi:putative mitochondrial electron transfer protein [Leptomonas pyrrhocoris]|uniref:Putative mitochondrial electron transfer protein n=1 Tax=Leptomonas pyrrhocoris TaxID=157538 RepID=A0A0M9G728_LEPPY|nr:putative mitochondrial electron transfer protein [Leptomonas pyrrhocoris]KPA83827.1 putative mitochondrial electron transfer protein [Leptomonas pyrrhocoris]|eukprot:XP_015662266.1 putative mitochondrial electron transfer protein [Leptomonas pyrrhocoris]
MLRKVGTRPYKTMVRRMAATDAAAEVNTSKAVLQLVRFDPETNSSRVESYEYDKHHDYMVLDLLIAVKAHQDPTLAFRSSCCEGVCGSCAMNINGINSLACITFAQHVTTIGPLPNFPVIKDFVVDLRYFFQQYAYIRPFVRNANLHRSQVDGIVDRYNSIARALTGVSPAEGRAMDEAKLVVASTQKSETTIAALLRIADAAVDAGNVTQVLSVLERVEKLGTTLDAAKVTELIERALKNYAAKAN